MKGKVVSVKHRTYEYQGSQRDVWDIVVDLGDDKKKKYNCSQKQSASFTEGQEIEFQEEAGKEYTDNEGMTRQNWKMILPKTGGGSYQGGGGGWKGKSKEELLQGLLTMTFSYSKDLTQTAVEQKLIKDMADAQKWTIDSFELFVPVIRKVYLSILEAEK
jgi:hypothetical protein